MVHIFHPSTGEAEAGAPLWVPGQPGLHRQFRDSQGFTVRPSLRKKAKQSKAFCTEPMTVSMTMFHIQEHSLSLLTDFQTCKEKCKVQLILVPQNEYQTQISHHDSNLMKKANKILKLVIDSNICPYTPKTNNSG